MQTFFPSLIGRCDMLAESRAAFVHPQQPTQHHRKNRMKFPFATFLIAASTALAGFAIPLQASAQSEASAALSLLPIASVVGATSEAGTDASAILAVPAVLSVGGSVLTVVAVQASVDGTVYLLERASDGARASVKVTGRVLNGASTVVGTAVVLSVIGTGVVLSVAGELLAFIPNASGRALLHNEKLS